jgi:acetyl-CoA acetyltransferase
MSGHPLRDRTAVVGVGYTELSKRSGVTTQTLALRAIRNAVEDAGLEVADLDGVACHRVNADSIQATLVAHALGIRDLRYHLDMAGGGSASVSVLNSAAMAVATGTAETVVCWRAINARSGVRMGGTGQAAPVTPEFAYLAAQGYTTPPQQFACLTRAYLHTFGIEPEVLGRVAINQRDNAIKNERAMMRSPLDMEAYLASRWIAEPLRLFDCCLETDAAVALVVTSAERARDLRQKPVLISGAVTGGGFLSYSNGRDDLTTTSAAESSVRLWDMAGVGPDDVDVVEFYDAFSPLVLMQLEDYGFCKKGEAADLVRDGVTALGGRLPVNTHGGFLSEGYIHGLNHVAEAVAQLRGTCGERQVPDARVALSTGQPGLTSGLTCAVVLRGDA